MLFIINVEFLTSDRKYNTLRVRSDWVPDSTRIVAWIWSHDFIDRQNGSLFRGFNFIAEIRTGFHSLSIFSPFKEYGKRSIFERTKDTERRAFA